MKEVCPCNKESTVILKDIRYLLTQVVCGGCVDYSEQDFQIIKSVVDNCIVPWKDAKVGF